MFPNLRWVIKVNPNKYVIFEKKKIPNNLPYLKYSLKRNAKGKSLLNCASRELKMCFVYERTCLACLRTYVPTCPACLHAHVPTCLMCSRVHVPISLLCLRAHMPKYLACSRASMPCVFSRSHSNVLCVLTCSRSNVPMCLARKVATCLACSRTEVINSFFWSEIVLLPCLLYWDDKSLLIKVEVRRVTRNACHSLINNKHFIDVDPVKYIKR